MRILLVGEYSNFHNSVKEGLVALGHQVFIVSDNDFKNYPVDLNIRARYTTDNWLLNKIRQVIFRLSKVDIAHYEVAWNFWKNRKQLTGFDVIQLINEYPLQSPPHLEAKLLDYLFQNNGKAFLISTSDDYLCVKAMLQGKYRYSVLTPCESYPKATHCAFTLKYKRPVFERLHQFVYQNIHAVVASDMDYYVGLLGHPQFDGLMPNAINTSKLPFTPLKIMDKVIIFHGINEANYYKKGNYIFEQALEIVQQTHRDRIEIITTRSVPYAEYMEKYNRAHIVLDQVFSYDQGYNALEAMAKGKVVFTGAEKEFIEYYQLTQTVCVNALPNAQAIAAELIKLIENPAELVEIGKRARAFVEKEHDHLKIAQRYLDWWATY